MNKDDPRRAPTEEELDELNEHWHDPGDPDGVVAEDQRQQWQAENPPPVPPAPGEPKPKRHRLLKAAIVIVVIALAGVGAYWYGGHKAATPAPKTPVSKTPATTTPTPQAVATKHYDSTNYTLGFDYPTTWKVTDTTTRLTVASDAQNLKLTDGSTAELHALVTIQNQQSTLPGYPSGGATAALESTKLTYKQPTTIQRAQTYLSFLAYKTPTGLDALYITGDSGYQQGQTVPMSDVVKGNPLVGVSFVSCTSDDCASGTVTPKTILASTWAGSMLGKQINALLESIQLN